MKNFRLTFVKIALCDVVGSERKMRVWETSQQAKCDAFYGKGYSFPMLAIQLFFLRQFNTVVAVFPARISQYDSSVVGFARLWGIELFHIYLAGF